MDGEDETCPACGAPMLTIRWNDLGGGRRVGADWACPNDCPNRLKPEVYNAAVVRRQAQQRGR